MPITTSSTTIQETSFADKRYFPRWEVKNRVLFQKENDLEVQEGYTKDLSCAGTCLYTDQQLALHQKLKLVVYLSEEISLSLQGIIVWIKTEASVYKIGVIFYNTPLEAHDTMLQFAFSLNKEKFLNHIFQGWDGK